MTPAFDRSSSLTPPGSSRPGAAFWRACVAFEGLRSVFLPKASCARRVVRRLELPKKRGAARNERMGVSMIR